MFFVLSKILWAIFVPSTALMLATILVFALVWCKRFYRGPVILLTAIYAVLLIFPVGDWVLGRLETTVTALPSQLDGIIVLGGSVDNQLTTEHHMLTLNDTAERLTVLPELIRTHLDAKIVFTGGSGSLRQQDSREADHVQDLFVQWGLPISGMIFERDSRNTYENAMYSKKLVNPQPHQNWLLVTSAAHMPRALGVFTKAGWPVIPYNVDYRAQIEPPLLCFCALGNLQKLDQFAYEVTGSLIYRLTGKI